MPNVGAACEEIPLSATSSGSAAVRMITRMVCTTAIAGDVGALLDREDGDLRQRAGAAGQQRRGLDPSHERAADRRLLPKVEQKVASASRPMVSG